MEYSHKTVLPVEAVKWLNCTRGSILVDCTLGGAGHSETILRFISPNGFLLGIDQDEAAIEAARARLARFSRHFKIYHGNFADIDIFIKDAGLSQTDGFLLDLGLSSFQIDDRSRGFSYQEDAPLDMRFDSRGPKTAADVVNTYSRAELAKVIESYGEERWAGRIAKFIVDARQRGPIETTGRLVDLIKSAIPAAARRRGGHPAKRTFQALRIEVNEELESLKRALSAMPKWLRFGGRIVIISYHSLEDRIAKTFFRDAAQGCVCPPEIAVCACDRKPVLKVLTKRPVRPTQAEIESNPRAKSARLRAAEKVADADS